MSIFQGSYKASSVGRVGPSELEQLIRSRWPNSGDVLFGNGAGDDGSIVVPSHKVLYWADGEYLHYCLSCPTTKQVAFGAIAAADVRLGMLERSLIAGEFAWKPAKRRRD